MTSTARIYQFPTTNDHEGRPPGAGRRSPLRSTDAPHGRRRVSHKATDWAWEQPVRGVRQHVLLAVAERANIKTRKCTPSLGELAQRTGLGESTIRGHLQALDSLGLIKAEWSKGGRRKRSVFTMLMDTPSVAVPETLQELDPLEGQETPQDVDPFQPETPQELETNPPGAGPVVPNTGTREPGREGVADAPPAADDGGMFAKPSTPASEKRDRTKVAQAIANSYRDTVKFSSYPAVLGVVQAALNSGDYSGEAVRAACTRLAGERRSLTIETLRVELEGFTPRSNGNQRNRTPLRERIRGGAA